MKRITNLLGMMTRSAPKVGQTPADLAWAENKWRLLHYRARPQGVAFRTPVLLIPSLINRHYVLDLVSGKSFVEFLVNQGFDVYCMDWGTPGAEDRHTTFEDIAEKAIGRALKLVGDTGPRRKAHVLGYCMGGTLAAIHGAVYPERFASLIGLAAPVRFHDSSMLSKWTNSRGYDVDLLVDTFGNAPWQLLQATFHMLRPTLTLLKWVALLDGADDDEFVAGFRALETWSNDNVSLPGEFFRRYVKGLYQADGLMTGQFSLGGKRVNLASIDFPTLAVTFEHDSIVPAESGRLLLERVSSPVKRHIHLPGTHVGAVVSKPAAKHLWPALTAFFAEHDAPDASMEVAESSSHASPPVEATPSPSPGNGKAPRSRKPPVATPRPRGSRAAEGPRALLRQGETAGAR